MNIKQAKLEITNTLKAYLAKDGLGNYMIPSIRQRPVLLMGPPGIGKTQIMEQIASETGVGLVAYTITHHTRQSALGLPYIVKREYGGEEVPVTEYTMSEILASVHLLMERTKLKEGILFLDEINCVSETLAPMMLQFLQCKTFGNRKLPEGWLIVAAGNPPEYNKSVRDFDVVTLDRVKRIDVREDFTVWKEYALKKALHGAVISYLDIKKENFYKIENSVDGPQFATARGWEDLSELITVYEKLGIRVNGDVVGQYIQLPNVAKDFAGYLGLYYKYQRTYHIDDILKGEWEPVTVSELRAAPFDEKLSVMGLLVSRMSESAGNARKQDALTTALHGTLKEFKKRVAEESAEQVLEAQISCLHEQIKLEKEAGRLEKETKELKQKEINVLESYKSKLLNLGKLTPEGTMGMVSEWFREEVSGRKELGDKAGREFDNAFRFLEEALGQSQELVIFVTEVTAGYNTSWFVENFGCDAYFRHNKELLFDDTRKRILEQLRN